MFTNLEVKLTPVDELIIAQLKPDEFKDFSFINYEYGLVYE
jgi:hypothetical protein